MSNLNDRALVVCTLPIAQHHLLLADYRVLRNIVTAMTRDGTLLIEDGEIAGPVKNLRFTQSILEAFGEAEQIGEETTLTREAFIENFIGGIRVPALKIGRFAFTSATEF